MPVKYDVSEPPAELRGDRQEKCAHSFPIREEGARCEKCSVEFMTDKQRDYIDSLLNGRMMTEEESTKARAQFDAGLDKRLASRWITRLLTLPKGSSVFARRNEGGAEALPAVENGRYAIIDPRDNIDKPTLMFYRVKTGKENGRWAGFTFLDAGRGGAHGDLVWTPIKNFAYKGLVMKAIAEDPIGAGRKFGQEVGVCFRCGRSLTQEHTRAAGVGDDCAAIRGI
jgi:hypothetical protein